jgi:hypothetical protein
MVEGSGHNGGENKDGNLEVASKRVSSGHAAKKSSSSYATTGKQLPSNPSLGLLVALFVSIWHKPLVQRSPPPRWKQTPSLLGWHVLAAKASS